MDQCTSNPPGYHSEIIEDWMQNGLTEDQRVKRFMAASTHTKNKYVKQIGKI